LAEPTFDRARFEAQLSTRTLGRHLLARAEVASTNDVAWDALAAGTPDGTVVVADAQTAGRGRLGRPWVTAPGRGLALSLLLHLGCDRRQAGAIPLVAGLALARGIARLGIEAQLKWPNDLLLEGRKLAGILCEGRHDAAGGDAVVVGVGVNVAQRAEDFPPELTAQATSLALAGLATSREVVAAEFLDAFEPLWIELQEGDRSAVLEAWQARASFWGSAVTVRTPSGVLSGIARSLDPDGGLVLTLADGRDTVVMAGDVDPAATPE
jgi:BirA family transcriptional regulator, biotin operon repressor / biotin---[acetyl-CoA-carboxylase] ligase